MERRSFLTIAMVSSLTLSGCAENESHEVGLGEIKMTNVRERNVTPIITVEKEDNTVYTEEHDLAGTENGPVGNVVIREDWMSDDTFYNVIVTVDNEYQNSISSEDANDFFSDWGDNECYSLTVVFEENQINFALHGLKSCP